MKAPTKAKMDKPKSEEIWEITIEALSEEGEEEKKK